LPEGVRSEVGGELEYGDEAMPQIFGGIAIAMVIIFFFLLFNFKKFGITTICMVALALMMPGALIGLGLMGRTLGLTSIFGLITLMGMIMRNEILIFEHANAVVDKYVDWNPKWRRATTITRLCAKPQLRPEAAVWYQSSSLQPPPQWALCQ